MAITANPAMAPEDKEVPVLWSVTSAAPPVVAKEGEGVVEPDSA